VPEDHSGGPDPFDIGSAYAEGKRAAELLCAFAGRRHGVPAKVARCFTFVGPHLPLDAQFAVGNFLRDALAGGPVRVTGDGTTVRSYLYAADLAVWLWTILLRGKTARAYNVGSEEPVTIAELARLVADSFEPPRDVVISRTPAPGRLPERYVPSVRRAATELGLEYRIPLAEAILRTVRWHRARQGP
jgi:dTDP-glucose 4,6-dehydratase